jgi:rubrerythrin
MTNELKEKILAWVERITRYKGNDFILDEETNELLAIIDEGIEEEVYKNMIENAGLLNFYRCQKCGKVSVATKPTEYVNCPCGGELNKLN